VGRAHHTKRLLSTRTDLTVPGIGILFDYLEHHMLRHSDTHVHHGMAATVGQKADLRDLASTLHG
jgi:hypothetical protein